MIRLVSHRSLIGLSVALGLCSAPLQAGVRVQPMSYDLRPAGSATKQDLRVENTASTPTPVEVRVERREVMPDGTDKRTPAEDDFLVFPPQGILPANGFQTFRVQYIGDPVIPATRLYIITIAQLPVSATGTPVTGVQIVYNIGTMAAVSPDGAQANIVVTGVAPAADAKMIRVTAENRGSRYARLRNGSWTLTSGDGKVEKLEGEALRKALENSLIDAGKSRVINLPVSDGFRREGATASFQLTAGS